MCPSPRTRAGTAPEEIDKPREYRPTRTPQHRKRNVGQLRDSEKGFSRYARSVPSRGSAVDGMVKGFTRQDLRPPQADATGFSSAGTRPRYSAPAVERRPNFAR